MSNVLPYALVSYSVTGGAYEYFTNTSRDSVRIRTGDPSPLLHHWSGRNPLIGLIAPVSESVWEHMKLLFFPMLLFGLWSLKGVTDACRLSAFHAGLLIGTFLIPVLFYAYTSVLGRNFLVLDIALFYICVIAAFLIYRGLSGSCLLEKYSHVTSMAVFLLLICFLLFTYFPPGFSIFREPKE